MQIAIAADGGTIHARLSDGTDLYLDGRLGSETKGVVFSAYPGKPEARVVPDPDGALATAIRKVADDQAVLWKARREAE